MSLLKRKEVNGFDSIAKSIAAVPIILAHFTTPSLSYSQNYHVKYLDVSQGMPTNATQAVYQDRKGLLWFGTMGSGIMEYDGQNLKNYSKKDGLISDVIFDIAEDAWGNLIIATDKGISVKSNNTFFNYTHSKGSNFVNRVYLSNDSTLYFAVDDGAYSYKQGKLEKVLPGIIQNQVRDFAEDQAGNLWIATVSGLFSKKGNTHSKKGIQDGLPDEQMNAVEYDKRTNTIWVAHTKGVSGINKEGIRNIELGREANQNYTLDIKIMSDSSIWTCGFDYARRIRLDSVETIGREGLGIKSKEISRMIEDCFGNIWLATSTSGIALLQKKPFSKLTFSEFEDLGILGISPSDRDNFWVSTEQGAFKLNEKEIIDFVDISKGLSNNLISALKTDYDENLWLNNENVGPMVYDGVKAYDPFRGKFPFEQANLITTLKDSTVLLTASGGIVLYKNKKWKTFTGKNDFPINIVLDGCDDNQGNLWLTSNNGIIKFDPEHKTYTHFTTKNGLHDDINFSIESDPKGNIWFASLSEGIGKYDGKNFEYFDTKKGLADNNTRSLTIDEKGNVWIGTVSGISLLKSEHNSKTTITNFTLNDGALRGAGIDAMAGLKNGKIAAGTENGLCIFQPKNAIKPFQKPIFYVEKIKEDDREYAFTGKIKVKEKTPLRIFLRAINYNDFDPPKYTYSLKGYTNDVLQSTSPELNLYSLPSGKYTLEVSAVDSWGNESEKISIDIEVIPPVWKRAWFILLSLLISAALIIWAVKRKIKNIRNKETEKSNTYRRIAELEMKALKSQMNPHFVFNALNSIQNLIAKGDQRNAIKYLSDFGHLVRLNLENSSKDRISVKEEIDFLTFYFEMEKMRFGNQFTLVIECDKNIPPDEKCIPPMMIQPLVENSIKHGLLPAGEGEIIVRFKEETDPGYIIIQVEDNGVGYSVNHTKKEYNSLGLKIIEDRLQFIHNQKNSHLTIYNKSEKGSHAKGTLVSFKIPR
jgi:ligand-binding sensor domain-containing protein